MGGQDQHLGERCCAQSAQLKDDFLHNKNIFLAYLKNKQNKYSPKLLVVFLLGFSGEEHHDGVGHRRIQTQQGSVCSWWIGWAEEIGWTAEEMLQE